MKRFHLFRINLVFMIAGVLAVVALINVSVMRSRRSMVQVELETVANYQISSKMKSAAFPAVVWDNLIQADDGEVKDYLNRSEQILKDYGNDEIESLVAAPDGVIQYVYPYSFSDQIGTDLESQPSLRECVIRSRYTGLDTVSAPEPLEDGDHRLYFCHPVYLKDRVGKASFWGYSIVTVRVSKLVSSLRLDEMSTRSNLKLYRMDERSGDEILYEDMPQKLYRPVRYYFSVPNGTMVLEGMWEGGWITKNEMLIEALICLSVIILGVLLLMNLRIRKNMRALSKISYSDELTGLYNRHMLRKVFEDLDGVQKHVAMVFVDFDHFKEINDREGHDAGDEVLRQGAAFFASVFGKESCFRYGGDEFLMMLQDIPDEEVHAKADRLKEFHSIVFRGRRIEVSVSGGIASADCSSIEDLRRLIREADSSLYLAKENGRDRVIGGEA